RLTLVDHDGILRLLALMAGRHRGDPIIPFGQRAWVPIIAVDIVAGVLALLAQFVSGSRCIRGSDENFYLLDALTIEPFGLGLDRLLGRDIGTGAGLEEFHLDAEAVVHRIGGFPLFARFVRRHDAELVLAVAQDGGIPRQGEAMVYFLPLRG